MSMANENSINAGKWGRADGIPEIEVLFIAHCIISRGQEYAISTEAPLLAVITYRRIINGQHWPIRQLS